MRVAQLVGTAEVDCVDLVRRAATECYGVDMPDPRAVPITTVHAAGWMETETIEPQPGDVVLMVGRHHGHHLGIMDESGKLVLHMADGIRAVLTPFRRLRVLVRSVWRYVGGRACGA